MGTVNTCSVDLHLARIYNGTRREGVGVIKSLFGRKKKKLTGATSLAEGVRDAVVGDVFTIMGFDVEYDDGYYPIEAKAPVRDQLQHMV